MLRRDKTGGPVVTLDYKVDKVIIGDIVAGCTGCAVAPLRCVVVRPNVGNTTHFQYRQLMARDRSGPPTQRHLGSEWHNDLQRCQRQAPDNAPHRLLGNTRHGELCEYQGNDFAVLVARKQLTTGSVRYVQARRARGDRLQVRASIVLRVELDIAC